MYCRRKGCGYVLDGLPQHRCPECGLLFDPCDPSTFATAPPPSRPAQMLRMLRTAKSKSIGMYERHKTAIISLCIFSVLAFVWLLRQHNIEREAVSDFLSSVALASETRNDIRWGHRTAPRGPAWLSRFLEPFERRLPRFLRTEVAIEADVASNDSLAHLRGLPNLTTVRVGGPQVTDAGLVHLEGLTRLQKLDLRHTAVTEEGIAKLRRALPKTTIIGPM